MSRENLSKVPKEPVNSSISYENSDMTNGVQTFVNGDIYTGEFLNGKKHGQATFSYRNGDKYVGGFINDKKHGQGTYTWSCLLYTSDAADE